MKYTVTFVQYHTYTVDAADEETAFDKAHEEFTSDMRRPVANTWYDSFDIECEDEEEDDHSCETCRWDNLPINALDNPCWNCKGKHSEWSPKK